MKHGLAMVGLLVTVTAGGALASPAPTGQGQPVLTDSGLRFAQAVSLPDLPPSSLRRLTFYSDKTIIALFDLANEDLAAGQNGATISNDTTTALRVSIERLIGAGDKANLDVDQVALFFEQEVQVRFSGPIPLILLGIDGEVDATNLFRGIALAQASASAPVASSDLLSLLANESASMSTTSGSAPATDSPVIVDTAEEIIRDPAVQSILDRTSSSRGQRTIKVIPGDTLAGYAQAFYGDTLRYRTIFLANTDQLDSPNLLTVGQTLIIPDS